MRKPAEFRMRLVVLDFETFFDQDYSLSKMSTESYVRDPRFQAHGAAVKWSQNTLAHWYTERQLREILKHEDWSDTFVIAHHCQFDGLILSHRYAVHPRCLGCTLSMSRLVLGNHISVSLDSVRAHFGFPAKRTPYHLFKGKHWNELDQATQETIAEGACDEVESIWKIFTTLMNDGFPRSELEIIDETIKMFTEPVLHADTDLLGALWESEDKRKKDQLKTLGVTEADLQSADKFKTLLEAEGVEIEYKDGGIRKNGKSELIPAFAKTDEFMRELLEDDNPRIRALASTRLGVKSTLLQTRAETLGWMASRGALPVYLRYAGAHTTRWSGGDRCNWQNFKRGSDIRKAIMAPEGWLLGVIDLSQIECRILDYVAGQEDELEKFRRGQDPYIGIASQFYNRPITKLNALERGTGKQAILSCLGPDTLVLTDSGPKPITTVQPNDRLWDGYEWVAHYGVLSRGERFVISVAGLSVTPDHLILCGNMWRAASTLIGENFLFQALERALDYLCLQNAQSIMQVIGKEIFDLQHDVKTCSTGEQWQNSKRKMNVYDIACAGPRNRFTVVSCAGPLIVHNCGYGCGAAKFQKTAALGIYGPPVTLSTDDAAKAVKLYRDTHKAVVGYWREADAAIVKLFNKESFQWGPLRICDGKIYLPNDAPLDYTTLEFYTDHENGEQYWRIKKRNGWTKLYGAKLVENVVQALARVVLSDAMLRIRRQGLRIVTCSHDELVVLIKANGHSSEALNACMEAMKQEPTWMPGIPLDCEATIGERYSK